MHGRFANPVIKAKFARNQIEQPPGQRFGDVRDAFLDRDPGRAQQIFHIRRDAHARIFDELKRFIEDAFDQRFVEQFEFWSHKRLFRPGPSGAKAQNPKATNAALEGPLFHGGVRR